MSVCRKLTINVSVCFIYLNLCVYCNSEVTEGTSCVQKSGTTGTCISLTNCESALNMIDQRKSPVFCNPGSEVNFNALVCCNNGAHVRESLGERLSLAMCKKYYPQLFRPDPPNLFHIHVVSGRKTLAKEFSHMALIGYGDKGDIRWLCGGSLISKKFVLTAAHCIQNNLGSPEWVRLGELDTANTTDDADPKDFKVIRATAHPNYQPPSVYHDIGLLELDREVVVTPYIKPACLYQSSDLSSLKSASATGWGTTSFGGQSSSHLMAVDLLLVDTIKCNNFYKKLHGKQLSRGIIDNIQICAGGNDGKDTCQGDSGGPLQLLKPESKKRGNLGGNVYDIIGLTSFGVACGLANTPGVYTRVFSYLDWIESIVWS